MNLKTLLLKGLSTDKAIRYCYRVQFGHSRFVIRFEVFGKNIRLLLVKKLPAAKQSFRHRLRRRLRLMTEYRRNTRRFLSKRPQVKSFTECGTTARPGAWDKQTQANTVAPQMRSQTAATDIITLKSTYQQTLFTLKYNLMRNVGQPQTMAPPAVPPSPVIKCTQTASEIESVGIQCKAISTSTTTQTDELVTNSTATQVWNDVESPKPELTADTSAIIYMLNELGEMIVNQTQVLGSNHKILNQLSEINALSKRNELGQIWRQRAQRTRLRTTWSRPSVSLSLANGIGDQASRQCDYKLQALKACAFSSKLTQTDKPQYLDKCFQTTTGVWKTKRLPMLRKSKVPLSKKE